MGPSSSIDSSISSPIALPLADPADVAAAEPQATRSRRREDIADRYKWNLTDIFESWDAWEAGYKSLEAGIDRYVASLGVLGGGAAMIAVGGTRADEPMILGGAVMTVVGAAIAVLAGWIFWHGRMIYRPQAATVWR